MKKEVVTPEILSVTTSSIGPTFPPQEASFGRIKGFDTRRIVRNRADVIEYVEMMQELIARLDNATSRISFRFIADNCVIEESQDLLAKYGEVVIPLAGAGDGFDSMSMVYIGYNAPGVRDGHPDDLNRAQINVENALRTQTIPHREIIARAQDQGYNLETPNITQRTTNEDFRTQMAELYARFGWSPENVMEILEQSHNIFAVAKKDGKVVSAGIAERAEIEIADGVQGNHVLRIAELTEAATISEHQGRGLYTAVAAHLLVAIANLPEDEKLHLAFGESNGLAPGVLIAAKRLGRTLAIEVAKARKLPISGYLRQHVPIEGAERNAQFNDLFPAFIVASEILRLYGRN